MTPAEQADLAHRTLARRRLLDFTTYTKQDYRTNWHHQVLANALDKVADGDPAYRRIMVFMPPQHGKLLADDTPVFTPNGWTTHGKLCVGEWVFGRDGKPVQIVAVSSPGNANCEVEFTDGAIICCHSAHEWMVFNSQINPKPEQILETREMLDRGVWVGGHGRGGRGRFQVDANVRIELPETLDLPLHPYILGAWLGNGSTSKNCISQASCDMAVIDKIEHLGIKATSVCVHPETGVLSIYFRQLYKILKSTGLLGNKHIPAAYARSSVDQRLELIAGMMVDTDGYTYSANGRITFSNTNERLIHDGAKIVRSLGWRTSIYRTEPVLSSSGIQGKKPVFQLCFNPTTPIPCVLSRKQTVILDPLIRKRSIVEIRSCKPRRGKCIQVDGGVYLVGETFVPTHNSELVSRRFPAFLLGKNPNIRIIQASHTADLAVSMNRWVQRIMLEKDYARVFPESTIAPYYQRDSTKIASRRTMDYFEIPGHNGSLRSAGVGNSIAGNPADAVIIDDPFGKREDADSATMREKVWDWYANDLRTRLQTDAWIVITHTRWHRDDLAGRLLRKMADRDADQWTTITLPAILEPGDSFDFLDERRPGGSAEFDRALWPAFKDEKELKIIQETDAKAWAALYQQNPTDAATADWYAALQGDWMWCQEGKWPEKFDLKVVCVDASKGKDAKKGDYTAIVFMGIAGGLLWIDAKIERIPLDQVVRKTIVFCDEHKPDMVGIEAEQFQELLVHEFRRQLGDDWTKNWPIYMMMTKGLSKEFRIRRLDQYITNREIRLRSDSPGCRLLLDQLMDFPTADHDDGPDALEMTVRLPREAMA